MNSFNPYRLAKFVLAFVLFFLLVSLIVMSLWNWLMPGIFGIRKITYLEASGVLLLSKILFGGFNKEHFKKKFSCEDEKDIHLVNNKKQTQLTSEQKSLLKNQFYTKWCKKEYKEFDDNNEIEI